TDREMALSCHALSSLNPSGEPQLFGVRNRQHSLNLLASCIPHSRLHLAQVMVVTAVLRCGTRRMNGIVCRVHRTPSRLEDLQQLVALIPVDACTAFALFEASRKVIGAPAVTRLLFAWATVEESLERHQIVAAGQECVKFLGGVRGAGSKLAG